MDTGVFGELLNLRCVYYVMGMDIKSSLIGEDKTVKINRKSWHYKLVNNFIAHMSGLPPSFSISSGLISSLSFAAYLFILSIALSVHCIRTFVEICLFIPLWPIKKLNSYKIEIEDK